MRTYDPGATAPYCPTVSMYLGTGVGNLLAWLRAVLYSIGRMCADHVRHRGHPCTVGSGTHCTVERLCRVDNRGLPVSTDKHALQQQLLVREGLNSAQRLHMVNTSAVAECFSGCAGS